MHFIFKLRIPFHLVVPLQPQGLVRILEHYHNMNIGRAHYMPGTVITA